MTREQQMMNAADRYADEVCDESCTGAQVAETINDFCAGWREADQHPHWISVEDELPKAEGRYIIADKYGGVEQMNFDAESKCWWLRGKGEMSDFVTHWMPLPKAPRKED